MSKQRKIRDYLEQLSETRGILEAMKNLAVVELNKLDRLLENQHEIILDLEAVASDFLEFYPYTFTGGDHQPDILILFGSERGFCGDFNDSLINFLNTQNKEFPVKRLFLIAVGSRLCRRLEDDPRIDIFMEGADVVEEMSQVLNRLLLRIGELQKLHGICTVNTLYHDTETGQVEINQLLPPFNNNTGDGKPYTTSPLIYLSPEEIFSNLVEYYLFSALYETAYKSLLAENQSRIRHMTAALDKLDEQSVELTRKYHTVRQEEITEEIEVSLLNASLLT